MKLQYYLRGLGIGILVTAMIFCILPGEKEVLSDEEIRARAAELGMVESSSLTLADIQNKQQAELETKHTEDVQMTGEIQPTEEAQPTKETQPPEETQPTKEMQPTEDVQESTEVQKPEEAEKVESTAQSEKDAETESTPISEVLIITIESGASSYKVSKLLEENLLVEDAGAFDNYLISNGYSRKIRVGTHEIPMNSTWEEIAKIISGK